MPLFRDKGRSKSFGLTSLSWEVPEKTLPYWQKKITKSKTIITSLFFSSVPEQNRTGWQNWQNFELVLLALCPRTIKYFLSLYPCKRKEHLFLCLAGQENPVPLDSLWDTFSKFNKKVTRNFISGPTQLLLVLSRQNGDLACEHGWSAKKGNSGHSTKAL